MTESQIVHQNGCYWVADADNQYTVYGDRLSASEADSSYERTPDGLTLAKARADYLARRSRRSLVAK